MSDDITQLLHNWVEGDKPSLDALTPLVYDKLRQIAGRIFHGERVNHTLQATALVNEAYVQLIDVNVNWQDRSHFFALAARLMRRILVDHAKGKGALKRGGGQVDFSLDDVVLISPDVGEEILNLHEAMNRLELIDKRMASILELHYFGGLGYDEMGEVLNLSNSALDRDMRFAKAWLKSALADD